MKWKPNAKQPHVFAILRADLFHGSDLDLSELITVEKIVLTEDRAVRETARLNDLVRRREVSYFW